MINDREIETVGEAYGLPPTDVEKDYVHSWLLDAIYQRPVLATSLVLKGGNGLRKAYLPNTRFSKDLDFSVVGAVDRDVLDRELREVMSAVEANTGVRFLDKVVIKDKSLPFEVAAIEARLYFKGFYNEESIDLKAQLDLTEFDRIYLPVQARPILHPYSDQAGLRSMVRCQKAEEILASKLTTLLHRRKAADLFDLVFGILRGGFEVSRREVITTFLKKSVFEGNPGDARAMLKETPLSEFAGLWAGLAMPRPSAFGFDIVVAQFAPLIDSLFDALAAVVGGGAALGASARVGLGASRVGGLTFASGARGAIMAAGRARTLVEITYYGYRRLVEPYRLAYYRRKDGVGQEYFWGFDTSGGKSGDRSMKSFFADQIKDARTTDRSYAPRYPVEF